MPQRAVAECVVASWEASPPRTLERVCRVLLAADAFSVTLLREHCLRRLAAVFDRVSHPAAAEQERVTFESFVAAVAPQVCPASPPLTLPISLPPSPLLSSPSPLLSHACATHAHVLRSHHMCIALWFTTPCCLISIMFCVVG